MTKEIEKEVVTMTKQVKIHILQEDVEESEIHEKI